MTSSPSHHVYDAARFTETDPRFRHCGVHIRWVALVATCVQILAISFEVASAYFYSKSEEDAHHAYVGHSPRLVHSSIWTVALWSALYLSCMASAMYGIIRLAPMWLIPQMVAQSITIVVASLESFLLMANLHNAHIHVRVSVLLLIAVAVTCLEIYCLWLGLRCYWYLRDASRYCRGLTGVAKTRRRRDMDASATEGGGSSPGSPRLTTGSPEAMADDDVLNDAASIYGSDVCLLESFGAQEPLD